MVGIAKTELIAAACNRTAHSVSWTSSSSNNNGDDDEKNLVAFGAGPFVALYEPLNTRYQGIKQTLRGHTDRVNCVHFLGNDNNDDLCTELVSGSADKTARVWKLDSEGKWVCSAVLEGHEQAIITLASLRTKNASNKNSSDEIDLIVTGATDGTIRIWERSVVDKHKDNVKCIQVINVGVKYAVSVAMSFLPSSMGQKDRHQIVLATGNTDLKIHLYVVTVNSNNSDSVPTEFVKVISLVGHEDWITDLAFTTYDPSPEGLLDNLTTNHWRSGDIILASTSQDRYTRLWRFSPVNSESGNPLPDGEGNAPAMSDAEKTQSLIDSLAASLSKGAKISDSNNSNTENKGTKDVATSSTQLSTRAHAFFSGDYAGGKGLQYTVSLDALLAGHDGWVHSAVWHNVKGSNTLKLLTASADQSIMVWYPDADTGVWTSEVRLGEVGGETAGFLGAYWNSKVTAVLAHGYQGSFHLWRKPDPSESSISWVADVAPSGHYESVQDVVWEPTNGRFLMSLSLDQTSRVYAPWLVSDKDNDESVTQRGWHELARSQIHGYDLRCAAFVSAFKYISGADEKIVRVFDATQSFASSLEKLSLDTGITFDEKVDLPKGASLPALGLSNKAVGEGNSASDGANNGDNTDKEDNIDYVRRQNHMDAEMVDSIHQSSLHKSHPPFEESLMRSTLWPEIDKLYGHPYEIYSVAVSNDGAYAATACKGAKESHSGIRIYNTKTWKQPIDQSTGAVCGPLLAHTLTITRLRFSPGNGDRYLLSVSRDRSWALFEKAEEGSSGNPYKLLWREEKAHARILWDASWTHDGRIFATASRDKTIKLWGTPSSLEGEDKTWKKPIATIKLPDAVTAVDFAPQFIDAKSAKGDVEGRAYCLAVGLECGRILLLTSQKITAGADGDTDMPLPTSWKLLAEIDQGIAHVSMINRLTWRPTRKETEKSYDSPLYLASGSDDQSVRIYSLKL